MVQLTGTETSTGLKTLSIHAIFGSNLTLSETQLRTILGNEMITGPEDVIVLILLLLPLVAAGFLIGAQQLGY